MASPLSSNGSSRFHSRNQAGGPKFWAANSFSYHKGAKKTTFNDSNNRFFSTQDIDRRMTHFNHNPTGENRRNSEENVLSWPGNSSISSSDDSQRHLIGGLANLSDATTEPIHHNENMPYISKPGFFNNGWRMDRPILPIKPTSGKHGGNSMNTTSRNNKHMISDGKCHNNNKFLTPPSRNLGASMAMDPSYRRDERDFQGSFRNSTINEMEMNRNSRGFDSLGNQVFNHFDHKKVSNSRANSQTNESHYVNPAMLKTPKESTLPRKYTERRHFTCPEQMGSTKSGSGFNKSSSGSLPDLLASPNFNLHTSSTTTSVRNLNFLRNVNKRANRAERLVNCLKLLSVLHLTCGVVLLSLDMALSLLKWSHLQSTETKVLYILRILYPVSLILIGCMTIASALQKRTSTYVLMVLCLAVLTTYCFVPTHTPLVQSMQDAIQFQGSSSSDGTVPTPEELFGDEAGGLLPYWLAEQQQPNRPDWLRYEDPLKNNGYEDFVKKIMGHLGEEMQVVYTIHHLNIAYSSIASIHIIVLILTSIAAGRAIYLDW